LSVIQWFVQLVNEFIGFVNKLVNRRGQLGQFGWLVSLYTDQVIGQSVQLFGDWSVSTLAGW